MCVIGTLALSCTLSPVPFWFLCVQHCYRRSLLLIAIRLLFVWQARPLLMYGLYDEAVASLEVMPRCSRPSFRQAESPLAFCKFLS